MKIVSIEGFVVSTTKYGESSKILNILTREYGIVGVISKGCMSVKSKNKVVSEKFIYANFNIYYKPGKLSTLISADVINYFTNIRSDITLIGYLTYLTELTHKVYTQSSIEDVYDIFISSVLKLDEKLNPIVITNITEIKYLEYLGVGLNLNECAICGKSSVVAISHKAGGYVCNKCYDGSGLTDASVIKMMKLYFYVDIKKISKLDIKDTTIKEIDTFLKSYYKDYTGLYIKSKEFLNKLENI